MATVTCDVCGGTFSQRHLASHKRLAHTKISASAAAPAAAPISEKEAMRKIALLYERLSVKGQKTIIRLLTMKDQINRNEQ
jgi:hypothetical protein